MATPPPTPTPGIVITAAEKYYALVALAVGLVALSYGLNVLPQLVGLSALSSSIIVGFALVAHDVEAQGEYPHLTFAVVTVLSALMAAVGYFSKTTTVELGAALTWIIAVLSYIYHNVANDAGANLPMYVENWATALTGLALAFLTWWQGNTDATTATLVATFATLIPQFVHVTAGEITPATPTTPPA